MMRFKLVQIEYSENRASLQRKLTAIDMPKKECVGFL